MTRLLVLTAALALGGCDTLRLIAERDPCFGNNWCRPDFGHSTGDAAGDGGAGGGGGGNGGGGNGCR